MRAKTLARVDRLRARIGEGCRACTDRPLVYFLGEHDTDPPTHCPACGRRFTGLIRVYLGVDPDDV